MLLRERRPFTPVIARKIQLGKIASRTFPLDSEEHTCPLCEVLLGCLRVTREPSREYLAHICEPCIDNKASQRDAIGHTDVCCLDAPQEVLFRIIQCSSRALWETMEVVVLAWRTLVIIH